MSWTDSFPVLTDEQVEQYRAAATSGERAALHALLGVDRTLNAQEGRHLVVTSLFWKKAAKAEGELPPVSRELMKDAGKLCLISRHAPWEHYVLPLLDGARSLKAERPEIVFRVYLAADLEFLVEDLVEAGCEVKLMLGSSIRHNPGAMWRFLALEEEGRWVTVTDSDRAREVLHDVERTEKIMKSGLGLWRVPYVFNTGRAVNSPGFYRPIIACQFGAIGGHPVELLMKAFLWHTMRGTMPDQCTLRKSTRGKKELPIYGTEWPTYGFDEWFLIAVIYPRMAFTGVLTFFPLKETTINHWFVLDIEYVTWANPKSEVLYFGESDLLRTKKDGARMPAESPILEQMLAESRRGRQIRSVSMPAGKRDRLTLVVARYKEDVRWLLRVPEDVTIVFYNKGPVIEDVRVMERIDHLHLLPNRGREADTYLHHLGRYDHDSDETWTVFCQGDPFPHSPDFLKLLEYRDAWAEVQPLTRGYIDNCGIPPAVLRNLETSEWIRGVAIRTELCSVRTMDFLSYDDHGGRRWAADYRTHHGLPQGWSIGGHFLECCSLSKLAEQAWKPVIARTAYGAIFAVRNGRLPLIDRKCLPRMRKLACGHHSHGYVFERLWMHLFGVPFVGVDEAAGRAADFRDVSGGAGCAGAG